MTVALAAAGSTTRRGPKAHLFDDGSAVVTGTDDVDTARRTLLEAYQTVNDHIWELLTDEARTELFPVSAARVTTGRSIPAHPEDQDFTWYWVEGRPLTERGVTRAVAWS